MRKLTFAMLGIGAVMGVLATGSPCPLGSTSVYRGATIQYKCQNDAGICSITVWNYKYGRACAWWCCFDAEGNNIGSILTDCGEWGDPLPEQCCNDLGTDPSPNCTGDPG